MPEADPFADSQVVVATTEEQVEMPLYALTRLSQLTTDLILPCRAAALPSIDNETEGEGHRLILDASARPSTCHGCTVSSPYAVHQKLISLLSQPIQPHRW